MQDKLTWTDITLEKYLEIQAIRDIDNLNFMMELIKIVFNIDDPESLPYTEILQYSENLKFMSEPIKEIALKNYYIINRKKYFLDNDMINIKAQQVIDYRNYAKEENNIAKILSVFLIPEGHKYNDGYSIQQVQDDILSMNMVDVFSISNFFLKAWQTCLEVFQDYFKETVENSEKIPEETKKELMNQLKDLIPDLTFGR